MIAKEEEKQKKVTTKEETTNVSLSAEKKDSKKEQISQNIVSNSKIENPFFEKIETNNTPIATVTKPKEPSASKEKEKGTTFAKTDPEYRFLQFDEATFSIFPFFV